MEKSIKFLAIAIIIGCMLITCALVYKTYTEATYNRYYYSEGKVFDKLTGKYYYAVLPGTTSVKFREIDPINKTQN